MKSESAPKKELHCTTKILSRWTRSYNSKKVKTVKLSKLLSSMKKDGPKTAILLSSSITSSLKKLTPKSTPAPQSLSSMTTSQETLPSPRKRGNCAMLLPTLFVKWKFQEPEELMESFHATTKPFNSRTVEEVQNLKRTTNKLKEKLRSPTQRPSSNLKFPSYVPKTPPTQVA